MSIYDRLEARGVTFDEKFSPRDAGEPIWGVKWTTEWWPDLARCGDMTWEQAYHAVLDLRDIVQVMQS